MPQYLAVTVPTGTTPVTATPALSPVTGIYSLAQTVTITDSTPTAVVYYTTNGATPTTSSAVYTNPFLVSVSTTVKAVALAPGYTISGVATASYVIETAANAPTFSPIAGTYATSQTVVISGTTTGSVFYYTVDGSTPTYPVTGTTTLYSAAVTVAASETIKAIAVATGYINSSVATAAYTISGAGYKFHPGDYLLSVNRYPTSSGSFNPSEVDLLASGASTATGIIGAVAGYNWSGLETAQGVYNFSQIDSDYAALQTANPGLRFGVYITTDDNNSLSNSALLTHVTNVVPTYIVQCGGSLTVNSVHYTLAGTAGNGGTNNGYGYGYSGYGEYVASQYAIVAIAMWEPGVVAAFNNFWAALAAHQVVWSVASGGDGNMYAINKHPLFEVVWNGNEVSYNFHQGPYTPPSSGSSACTVTTFWTGYLNWATSAAASFSNTMVGVNVTYGITGADGSQDATNAFNTTNGWLAATCSLSRPGLSGIQGIALGVSDCWGSSWSNTYGSNVGAQAQNSIQSFVGINPAIGETPSTALPLPTGLSLQGYMPILGQVQEPDYGQRMYSSSGHPASYYYLTAGGVQQIAQAMNGTTAPSSTQFTRGCGHGFWASSDQNFGTAWASYIHAAILASRLLYPVTVPRPSNLPGGYGQIGFNVLGIQYYSAQQPYLNVLNSAGANSNFTGWGTETSGGTDTSEEQYLSLDSNGYVTSLTGINFPGGHTQSFTQAATAILFNIGSAPSVTNPYPAGSYTFTISGTGTFYFQSYTNDINANSLTLVTGSGAAISGNGAVLSGTGTCVFTFTVGTPAQGMRLVITALPSSTYYLKPASLVRTSLQSLYASGEKFNPDYMALMATISPLRFMDATRTNTDIYGFNSASGTVAQGSTMASLASAWSYPSQTRNMYCMNGQTVTATFQAGVATVTWTPALTAALSTSFSVTGASGSQGCNNFYVSFRDTWSARPLPANLFWSLLQGPPIEILIAECNQLGADMWFNVPILATTSWLTSFHGLVANGTGISSGYSALSEKLWSEVGNEVWNYALSSQATMATIQGSTAFPAATAAGGSIYSAAQNWRGYIAAVNASIASNTWAAAFSRCIPMIACQIASSGTYGDQSGQLGSNYWTTQGVVGGYTGPATNYPIKACAVAPYFPAGGGDQMSATDFTVLSEQSDGGLNYLGQCFTSNVMSGGSNPGTTLSSVPAGGWYPQAIGYLTSYLTEFATHYPAIVVVCYEGGQQMFSNYLLTGAQFTAWNNLAVSINRNSFMGSLYSTYLGHWGAVKPNGSVNCLYNDVGIYGGGGAFGAIESTYEPTTDSPKWQAIQAFIG